MVEMQTLDQFLIKVVKQIRRIQEEWWLLLGETIKMRGFIYFNYIFN